ncbi:MAG: non-heme iron oxygenase ferredoxin subunit [Acidobacteriota bacterium]|nr:non-heme iron oxygenase ferredoxin subunit [Acidobacteriota bacterium]
MARYHKVASLDRLPPGEKLGVEVEGHEIFLCNVDGTIHALEDCCPHQGARLSDVGHLRPGQVLCVLHGACFDLGSGALLAPPAARDIHRYPVRVEGGAIYVEVE